MSMPSVAMAAMPNTTEFQRAFARECCGFPRFGANRATPSDRSDPARRARQNLPVPNGGTVRPGGDAKAGDRRFAVCEVEGEVEGQVERMCRTAWWARISLA
jgi:hypothetical protein